MKVAAVNFREQECKEIVERPELLLRRIKQWLQESQEKQIDLLVFPGLLGNFYKAVSSTQSLGHAYLEEILNISLAFKDITFCPGSWFETTRAKNGDSITFHSSALIQNGQILLRQRQLYLARWEKAFGISRGTELAIYQMEDFSICLFLPTDVFYPQVARYAALKGVNLVLAPSAIVGQKNFARQISGLWQKVQQNLFFAVESGFKGSFQERNFYTESVLHAPLAITPREDGFLKRECRYTPIESLSIHDLDLNHRLQAFKGFNPLTQLNPDFYKKNL